MARKRRRFTAEFKTRVVRAALREDKTLAELASEFGVHANQITDWKRQALEAMPEVFSRRKAADANAPSPRETGCPTDRRQPASWPTGPASPRKHLSVATIRPHPVFVAAEASEVPACVHPGMPSFRAAFAAPVDPSGGRCFEFAVPVDVEGPPRFGRLGQYRSPAAEVPPPRHTMQAPLPAIWCPD